jgi:UDP-N-acetylmuramoyl-L-alanyl-D-glutamate--2,6-diaminopimelate ligase
MVTKPARLSALIGGLEGYAVNGDPDALIDRITHDSRLAGPGSLFVAYQGVNEDVHRYIPDALSRGASVVLGERRWSGLRDEMGLPSDLTYVSVPNARFARSHVADALYGHPSRDMIVVGVTGTDGKTTTSMLVHAILEADGRRAGLVTTIGAQVGGERVDTGLHTTTPEPEDLHKYLAEMRGHGVEVVVLEATSHGLDQHRVSHVAFDVAAITNITHEALEYHETFSAYRRAKARLFQLTAASTRKASLRKCAVLNAGDGSFEQLSRISIDRQLTYSLSGPADFTAKAIGHTAGGLAFTAATPSGRFAVESPLLGQYNAANILAAMATAHALGVGPDAWVRGISEMRGIPGRMEAIAEGQPFIAVVDFAHTPNALTCALDTARDLLQPAGRVVAVFGCAGLRDKTKRSLMGRSAGEMADLTFVTAEDPRTEDLGIIIDAISAGIIDAGGREGRDFFKVPDRFEAIRGACAVARPSDVVIVMGKGHEQSMCFGETEYRWDDRDAMRAALREESYGNLPTALEG